MSAHKLKSPTSAPQKFCSQLNIMKMKISRVHAKLIEFRILIYLFSPFEIPFLLKSYFKHRHQRCKAHSLCKTFFITSNCQLKEAGQKKYFSHNVFLSTPFSPRFSHNVFLTMSFSQRLSHNVLFTTSFSPCCPYIFVHTM